VGAFYSFVTLAMGMKFGEHEYKVMGMARTRRRSSGPAEAALRESSISRPAGPPASAGARGRALPAPAARHGRLRFDWVAGGAQRLLEEVLLRWSRLMHERYGGGGSPWGAGSS